MSSPTPWQEITTKHPLAVFFVLSFAMAWGVWIPVYFFPELEIFMAYGAYAPAFAAIIATTALDPKSTVNGKSKFWLSLGLGWMAAFVSLLVAAPILQLGSLASADFILWAAFTSIPAGLVLSTAFSANLGRRNLTNSLVRLRGGVGIHLLAATLVPASFFIAGLLTQMVGSEVRRPLSESSLYATSLIWIVFVVVKIFHNNMLGEEVGWRGFALRHLQKKHSPFTASIVIAFLWSSWHLPYWLVEGSSNSEMLWVALSMFPMSIMLTWFYNRSGGSLWAVGLLHASINVSFKLLPLDLHTQFLTFTVIAVSFSFFGGMLKPRAEIDPDYAE